MELVAAGPQDVGAGADAHEPAVGDHRVVHVRLTDEGESRLAALTAAHLDELRIRRAGLFDSLA